MELLTSCGPANMLGPNLDPDEPFLEMPGVEGSFLRATRAGLTVLPCSRETIRPDLDVRFWRYDQIGSVRVDDFGPIGVVRARIEATGNELPLLLLEPDQITTARRVLEMVWNLMAAEGNRRVSA